MADGRDQSPGYFSFRATFPWMELFRCFQIALDPRKLLVAAAGILTMSLGWFVLSAVFYYKAPLPTDQEYSAGTLTKEYEGKTNPATGQPYTTDEAARLGMEKYQRDHAQWRVLADLAGPYGQTTKDPVTGRDVAVPPGRFRAMPWDEYRGPNPFQFVTTLISAPATQWWDRVTSYLTTAAPVLTEPLFKLLVPVAKIVSPGVSAQTRVYLFFLILWNVAVWAFFGGVITRLAALQVAGKGPVTIRQAVRFVATRYANYVSAPLVPLGIIAAVAIGLMVYGLFTLIPVVGDLLLLGLGLPLVILGGAVMAVFLVGLVGYPLMYPTLSVEGDQSDTFDALSRSINYVYQSPWHYIWYWLVSVLYGAAVIFFVLFFTSLMVYLGKWAVGMPASAVWSDRKPDYLFVYAPESFGWKELFLQDSPYAVTHDTVVSPAYRVADVYRPVNPELDRQSRDQFYFWNTWGAGLVAFWLGLLFLLMLGFSYSFFWSAATVIYFLLRRKVDEAEPDEVFLEEDEPEAPLAPPKIADGTAPASPPASTTTALPMIPAPPAASVPPPPPPPYVPPPPPVMPPPPPPIPVVPPPVTFIPPPEPEVGLGPGMSPPIPPEPPRPDGDRPPII